MFDSLAKITFWFSFTGILYAYLGYPLILLVLSKVKNKEKKINLNHSEFFPQISVIIPYFNEEKNLPEKIKNILEINYPKEKMEVILVSDGSDDRSDQIVEQYTNSNFHLYRLNTRQGKASALNLGLNNSNYEIIIFTDASILLDKNSIYNIVQPFFNPEIGCVSGEDHIYENSGEGFYGRYELWLRNLESEFGSIVGASGSFYAQRKELVEEFLPGMAPDFLSVLNTVEKGFQAVTESSACGTMKSVKKSTDEFSRKIRTLIRGMTALFYKKQLLNLYKYPDFAFNLISHKIFRWMVPWFLLLLFLANIYILELTSFYKIIFILQLFFYGLTVFSVLKVLNIHKTLLGRMCLYFSISNFAIIIAWFKYWMGENLEIWQPSNRIN